MKKRITLTVLALLCLLLLAACGCKHETWVDADCVTPKTCENCGETEGAPLGHTWATATCESPKTCESCGAIEGEALGHAWVDASCESAKACERCGLTEGDALGHNWEDATTEAPKTCAVCAATEGERIITDPRFTTAACRDLFGKWSCELTIPAEALGEGLDAYATDVPCQLFLEFTNDGKFILSFLPSDPAQIEQMMINFTVDLMYAQLAEAGLDAEAADAAMTEAYGMGVEAYVAAEIGKMDMADLFADFRMEAVYYVDGDQLYAGSSWAGELEPATFSLEDNTLTLEEDLAETGAENTVLTRVTE